MMLPEVIEHSSMSLQESRSGESSMPGAHSQRKEPGVLTQRPPRHSERSSRHSSISGENMCHDLKDLLNE